MQVGGGGSRFFHLLLLFAVFVLAFSTTHRSWRGGGSSIAWQDNIN